MFKVENKKIIFEVRKNGKIIKNIELKNRLTNLYLEYILYTMLPATIGDVLFPDMGDTNDGYFPTFTTSYLKFDDTQVISDTDTTMDYDERSTVPFFENYELITAEKSKILISKYLFDLSGVDNGSLFTGIGFGKRDEFASAYLFSFIDLSASGIYKTEDISFHIIRYDEVTSNETSLVADYLPFRITAFDNTGILNRIILCFGLNGTGDELPYYLNELSFSKTGVAEIEITGFINFLISDVSVYPREDLYPSDTLYPSQFGQIRSVKFEYVLTDEDTVTTYVNKNDLDLTYNDTQFKLKLKCERGVY